MNKNTFSASSIAALKVKTSVRAGLAESPRK